MKRHTTEIVLSMLFAFVSISCAQTIQDTAAQDSVKKITIKQSGFLKDDEVVISYRTSDHKIVEVIDKGEKIAKEDFHDYESILWSYLELRNIESLKPRIERLRREIRGRSRLDSAEFRRFRSVERKLDSLRSRLIRRNSRISDRLLETTLEMNRKLSDVRERTLDVVERINKLELFLDKLLDENIIESREDLEIEFRNGTCRINGKKVSDSTSERIKDIYKEIHGKEIDEDRFKLKM